MGAVKLIGIAVAALFAAACSHGSSDDAARARAEKGTLFKPDWLAIGIDEKLVEHLIGASLPLEGVIGDRFQARVERHADRPRGRRGGGDRPPAAGELPFHLEVARVVALNGQLWVLIEANVGSWAATPAHGTRGGP